MGACARFVLTPVDSAGATVGGGIGNADKHKHSTVGGGHSNDTTQVNAIIGGGEENSAGARSATIGGGELNGAGWRSATVGVVVWALVLFTAPGVVMADYTIVWQRIERCAAISSGGGLVLTDRIERADPNVGVMTGGRFELAGSIRPGVTDAKGVIPAMKEADPQVTNVSACANGMDRVLPLLTAGVISLYAVRRSGRANHAVDPPFDGRGVRRVCDAWTRLDPPYTVMGGNLRGTQRLRRRARRPRPKLGWGRSLPNGTEPRYDGG